MSLESVDGLPDEAHPRFARYTLLKLLGRGNFGKVSPIAVAGIS